MAQRCCPLAIAILILAAVTAATQTRAAPPTESDQSKLEEHLNNWHKEMAKIQTLAIECNRKSNLITFNRTDYFAGKAYFMKDGTDLYVRIEMDKMDKTDPTKKDKSGISECYISNPKMSYEFVPGEKKIRCTPIPPRKPGQAGDDNLLSVILGLSGNDALKRFDLKVKEASKGYVYINIVPKLAADKADFHDALICLHSDTNLLR